MVLVTLVFTALAVGCEGVNPLTPLNQENQSPLPFLRTPLADITKGNGGTGNILDGTGPGSECDAEGGTWRGTFCDNPDNVD